MKLFTGSSPLTALDLLQMCLTAACLLIAILSPGFGNGFFAWIERILRSSAQRRILAYTVAGGLPLVLRAVLLPVYGVPTPFVHDEYGYLLQADTFASGRLTNPTPPVPEHFESIYILTRPTYTSQYQPAQGMLLALGMRIARCQWVGVFLSMGVLCALLYWMLLAWLPTEWAFAGALLAIFQFGVLSYWMNSYFGGTVPAIGGTLVLGALPRLRASPSIWNSVLCTGGVVILLNSRPLEGLLLSLVSAGAVLFWVFAGRALTIRQASRKIFVPVGVMLTLTTGFELYYNYRVTGNPTEPPYVLNRKLYGTPQGFFWQNAFYVTTPMPRDVRMEYDKQLENHARRTSSRGLMVATGGKIRTFWSFYLGAALTLPLLLLPSIWRGPRMSLAAAALIAVGLDNLTFFAYEPHYSAAIIGLILLVVVLCLAGMRHLGASGLFLSRSLPLICAIGLVIPMIGRFVEPTLPAQVSGLSRFWNSEFQSPWPRERLCAQLVKQGGKHLVFVRYQYPEHNLDNEWVFNGANLDQTPVVWARELDPKSNRLLMKRFAGRKVWLGEPDTKPPRILPYPPIRSDR